MVNIAIGQVIQNDRVHFCTMKIIQNGLMIHLTMVVLLNNFVLVKQILKMLAVVVMIISKVKTG